MFAKKAKTKVTKKKKTKRSKPVEDLSVSDITTIVESEMPEQVIEEVVEDDYIPREVATDEMTLLFNTLRDTFEETPEGSYSQIQKNLSHRVNSCIADIADIIYDELGVDTNEDSYVLVEDLEDHLEDTGDLVIGYILQRT